MLALSHLKHSLYGVRAASTAVAKVSGRGGRSSDNDKTVTVFGGTGRVGKVVINSLGQSGTQVVVPHRGSHQYAAHLKLCGDLGVVHLVHLPNLGNAEEVEECVKHSDVVINLTGRDKARLHWSLEASNVDLTHRIARACKNMGVKKFIHMSHINASEDSPSEYLRTKYLSEVVVRHELPDAAVIVRSSDCFSRDDYLTSQTLASMKSLLPHDFFQSPPSRFKHWRMGKEKTLMPVYASDVARAIAMIALMQPDDMQQQYQFIGPKEYTMDEFASEMARLVHWKYTPVEDTFGNFVREIIKPDDLWLRMHTISDSPQEGLPGFADLGLTPVHLDDVVLKWTFHQRPYWQMYDAPDNVDRELRKVKVF